MVPSEKNTSGSLIEILETVNRQVLLVETVVVCNCLLSLSDNREHEWLTVICSVSTDTQVDFAWIRIIFVTDGET